MTESVPGLMKMTPHLVHKIWGGEKLSALKGGEQVGESWEIAAIRDGESQFGGKPLSSYINPEELFFLVKFLDTKDHLSVQVHPNETYAQAHENTSGKTECWLILDAEPGAGIYLGFKESISRENFYEKIQAGEDLSQCLNFYEVERGDFFFVPAGSIHAIGKGVMLLETQQSSGVTYRVWDWNRVDDNGKGRELHIEKALDVLDFQAKPNDFYLRFQDVFSQLENENIKLVEHPQFSLELLNIEGSFEFSQSKKGGGYMGLVCLEGEIEVIRDLEKVDLQSFESVFLPDEGHQLVQLKSLSTNAIVALVY